MSWGYKIIIFFGAFVTFMSFMFYKCLQQDFDLVATDYYSQEIGFQKQIDHQKNSQKLKQKPSWEINDQQFLLKFPNHINKGSIYFFRPSDDALDFEKDIQLNEALQQEIPITAFKKGFYILKLRWTNEGVDYYIEEKIRI